MDEKQKRSPRRSREEVAAVVAAFQASGLSQQEFCLRQGMAVATLGRYRRGQSKEGLSGQDRWLKVELAEEGSARARESDSKLTIALARGRRIEVSRGFDSTTLEQLVQILERA
jgi:transcriptional regulator with XRE-family HTH domain